MENWTKADGNENPIDAPADVSVDQPLVLMLIFPSLRGALRINLRYPISIVVIR